MSINVYLRRGGTGYDVYLRRDRSRSIDVYLFKGSGTDVYLRRDRRHGETAAVVGGPFPTQYSGLRIFYGGGEKELCLVAEADAPSGMGGVLKMRKGGTNYAVYLVETTDGNASSVRIRTSSGIKSIRIKT